MVKNKPEILAPCGNMDSLPAAVAAGADACYLAGNSFGARAFAGNFDREELLQAIDFAHLHGVKIYLTTNTLVKDNEFHRLYEMLLPLYEAGLDAVLVQDFGVMRFVRENFPELPIHTSTQMNILSPEGALLAKNRGASRIVAAREMTADELSKIRKEADIEVEAFVHGAMCVCYSGRCLMSSMAGGRSGNRGCCAQPCRRRYDGSYRLSMKDMCTIKYIPQLISSGIDSLKIEGRMKNSYYVAATVDSYRRMVDAYFDGTYTFEKAEREEKRLLDIFNRGGFTSGYLMLDPALRNEKRERHLIDSTKPGRRGVYLGKISEIKKGRIYFEAAQDIGRGDEIIIDLPQPVSITSGKDIKKGEVAELAAPETGRIRLKTSLYRTRNKKITDETEALIQKGRPVLIDMKCNIYNGSPMELTVMLRDTKEVSVTVHGDMVQKAQARPLDEGTVTQKLSKIGDKEFEVAGFQLNLDDNSFVPASALKQLRREALGALKENIIASYRRTFDFTEGTQENHEIDAYIDSYVDSDSRDKELAFKNREVHVAVNNMLQLKAIIKNSDVSGIHSIYIDFGLDGFNEDEVYNLLSEEKSAAQLLIMLPFVDRKPKKTEKLIRRYGNLVSGFYIRSIDDLKIVLDKIKSFEEEKTLVLANSLYAYNSLAVRELTDIIGDVAKIYFEAPAELSKSKSDAIYFPEGVKLIRTFYGRQEVMITDALGGWEGILNSETGSRYELKFSDSNGYSVIFEAKPVSLHNSINEIENRFYKFMDESPEDMEEILSGKFSIKDFTTGHYEKGI